LPIRSHMDMAFDLLNSPSPPQVQGSSGLMEIMAVDPLARLSVQSLVEALSTMYTRSHSPPLSLHEPRLWRIRRKTSPSMLATPYREVGRNQDMATPHQQAKRRSPAQLRSQLDRKTMRHKDWLIHFDSRKTSTGFQEPNKMRKFIKALRNKMCARQCAIRNISKTAEPGTVLVQWKRVCGISSVEQFVRGMNMSMKGRTITPASLANAK
jgi:hypothetical protein